MVAPSLVIMTSPSGETSILSIPFGPRDVFKRLATVTAARILIWKYGKKVVSKKMRMLTYLMCFETLGSLLLLLFSENNKWSS